MIVFITFLILHIYKKIQNIFFQTNKFLDIQNLPKSSKKHDLNIQFLSVSWCRKNILRHKKFTIIYFIWIFKQCMFLAIFHAVCTFT